MNSSVGRLAFFATDVFLRLNGFRIRVEARPAHDRLMSLLERGEADHAHLLEWLKAHIVPRG